MMIASPQARLNSSAPLGLESVISTWASSMALTLSIAANSAFCALVESSAMARSRLNFTSCEVKGAPSWKVTPSRSLKV